MKSLSPVLPVGLLLTAISVALFIWCPPFVQAVSNYAYDAFAKRICESPKSDRVVIVDLDEVSLSQIRQWPWPRDLMAKLTRRILDAGAAVIGFDIFFLEEDRASPVVFRERMKRDYGLDVALDAVPDDLKDFDRLFAEALRSGKTILGSVMVSSGGKRANPGVTTDTKCGDHIILRREASAPGNASVYAHTMRAERMQLSIPVLGGAAATAFVNAEPDSDNIVRSNPLVYALGTSCLCPSLALEAVRLYLGFPHCVVTYGEQGVVDIRLKDRAIPVDRHGRLLVNYRRTAEDPRTHIDSSFPSYPAADVLNGKTDSEALAGKIVLIGTSAVGLHDLKATPLASHFPGVQVHATIIDNILAGDMLIAPSWLPGVHVAVIVFTGLLVTLVIWRGRSWLSFLVTLALIALTVHLSLAILRRDRIVFVPSWVILSITITYPILTMIKYWEEERQKKKVRNMFGTMVSKDVLQYLERNPGSFSLTGHKAEVTIFFSDIAGFATISEILPPDQVSALLNRYLSPMTDIIMNRGGYVDKYEGDLIMAEWGVPFPRKDHAVQACLAALEQQEKLAEIRPKLKAEFGQEIDVRMGINTGIVTAGNMGSDRRFSFTVLGNPVNQAARFEPANKDYRTNIILGEETFAAAQEAIEARLLDRILVVGMTRPALIYELLGRKGQVPVEKQRVAALYVEALKAHWERRWDAADAILDEARQILPSDGPCATLRERVSRYRQTPPPDGWQGEYIRTSKD